MRSTVYKLKAHNQKKKEKKKKKHPKTNTKNHHKVGSGVTLSIWLPSVSLTGCVTFCESLNLSEPQLLNW